MGGRGGSPRSTQSTLGLSSGLIKTGLLNSRQNAEVSLGGRSEGGGGSPPVHPLQSCRKQKKKVGATFFFGGGACERFAIQLYITFIYKYNAALL